MEEEEFLKKLEVELKISKNSPYTIRNYLYSNKIFLDFIKKSPKKVNVNDVKYFISENLSNKSSASISLFLSAIRFSYSQILLKDITKGIKRPKKESKLPTILSKDEVKKLLSELKTEKSKLMASLMYACGFRVSETVNLKISNLNFNEKIGLIEQSKGRKPNYYEKMYPEEAYVKATLDAQESVARGWQLQYSSNAESHLKALKELEKAEKYYREAGLLR